MTKTDITTIIQNIFQCYTARNPSALVSLHKQSYSSKAHFIDPFVSAAPDTEVLLQFYSLQKLFSHVRIYDDSEPRIEDKDPATLKVLVDCKMEYEWSKASWFARTFLPDAPVPLECTLELEINKDTGKVERHTDYWLKPSVPAIPMAIRSFNAMFSNSIFRILGWERELYEDQESSAKVQ